MHRQMVGEAEGAGGPGAGGGWSSTGPTILMVSSGSMPTAKRAKEPFKGTGFSI